MQPGPGFAHACLDGNAALLTTPLYLKPAARDNPENICEGLDHVDAERPLDVAAATAQLRTAARHELSRRKAEAEGKAAAAAQPPADCS